MKPQIDDNYPALRVDLEYTQAQAQSMRAVYENWNSSSGTTTVVGTSGAPTPLGATLALPVHPHGLFEVDVRVWAVNAGAAIHNITIGVILGTAGGTGTTSAPAVAVASGTTAAEFVGGLHLIYGTSNFTGTSASFSVVAFADSSTVFTISSYEILVRELLQQGS